MSDTKPYDNNDPLSIAIKNKDQILQALADKFKINLEELVLITDDPSGTYFSNVEPDTLCSLIVCLTNGRMYLVAAKVNKDTLDLNGFKCSEIA